MQTMAGDDVAGIKRRRHDLSGDGVWILAMVYNILLLLLLVDERTREALEDQLLSVSLLTHLWKRECAERIP
ncbi:hypothetical protein Tco_0877776 [Tanacetum coccineum]|uniref:Uncharacterized protein n=1 Tax=Tanacetum coccineum TaxID=301880 RepID=A0ABQ5BW48_9ASTR